MTFISTDADIIEPPQQKDNNPQADPISPLAKGQYTFNLVGMIAVAVFDPILDHFRDF
jgi:hypothetical protein